MGVEYLKKILRLHSAVRPTLFSAFPFGYTAECLKGWGREGSEVVKKSKRILTCAKRTGTAGTIATHKSK